MRTRHRITAVAVGIAALAIGPLAALTTQAAVPSPDGWSLVWSDDFDGPAGTGLDTTDWIYDIGHSYPGGPANWGTGEIAYHTDSTQNVYQDGNGNLAIRPLRDSAGNWTSGRIETVRSDFEPAEGGVLRVEGRIQVPDVTGEAAQGIWPAFWMLGEPFRGNYWNWPGVGEIDILENVNGTNEVFATLHCGTSPGGPCNETIGLGGSTTCQVSTCQSAFHTYRMEWDRSGSVEQLRWYLDGNLFHTVDETDVDATTWSNATDHGFFIILNVAVGGDWPGLPTAATASGVPMLVDYVAVYESEGGDPDPDPTTPPPGDHDAYSTIQAEHYDAQSGVQTETTSDAGGGENVGWAANGDWIRFDGVDFGATAANTFSARVASGAGSGISGLVEVRLDDVNAEPIGSFAVANTGGWQSWRTVPANIAPTTGVHTVYLRFTSGQPADFVNVNWFTFSH
ncbi:glycoside hydrolase family 16 protein [Myceligenerans pegani]|uniref:Carbohydrate-binding protein n=1 Tax=Myceligenerans pegani TaxID=2776917 RepID=A0ABR9MW50_9MICO|nr:glycoside hydrolase family 16 protein [Myceligenerans sp. TRM 65318]MBE1875093.1 carbohydrate-binding protein [Myceligenerans sp. TRM 65318]MBE3017364.1 carbohydrate-binding protein [Myceligenerans sp. TRM 65318]